MRYVFACLFAIATAIQLWACYVKHRRMKDISKGFLMLFLLGWYLTAAVPINYLIVAAIIFSFIGDMLLIKDSLLLIGGVSFFFAHVAYVFSYAQTISWTAIPPAFCIGMAVFYFVLAVSMLGILYKFARPPYFAGAVLYLTMISAMGYFALMQWYCTGGIYAMLVYIGTLLFTISDFVLLSRNDQSKVFGFSQKYTVVMSTYIFAQALIVYGMAHIR